MCWGFTRATQQEHEVPRKRSLVDTFPIAAGPLVYSSDSSRKKKKCFVDFFSVT